MREVDIVPVLRDELIAYKVSRRRADLDDRVFTTATGAPRTKDNVRQRVIAPVVARADRLLAERDQQSLPAGITVHKLRHSFASLLVACGEDPAFVMGQLGPRTRSSRFASTPMGCVAMAMRKQGCRRS